MATETTFIMNDDLDPRISTGVETVTFHNPLDGTKMEIELGEANRKHFAAHLDKLVKYIAAARVVEAPKTEAKANKAAKGETAAIREWARANGFEVGLRGRIKPEIVEAFNKAQTVVVASTEQEPVEASENDTEAVEQVKPTSEVAEVENVSQEASEPVSVEDDNEAFKEFLQSAMNENGEISAASLAKAENV